MTSQLKYGLEKFDMLDQTGGSIGLVKVDELKNLQHEHLQIEEIIAIENALKYKAHYVYFRKFENRPSIPQIYIYDFSELTSAILEDDLISLHQRLYSSGHVPMFFIFTSQDIRIFNCYEKPARGKQLIYKPLTTIKLAADIFGKIGDENEKLFKAFSGKSIDNGTFWESSPFSKEFQFGNSAYEKLLGELKQALKDIIEKRILPAAIARKITVISILIKYLEERTDEYNNTVFPKPNDERKALVNGKRQRKKFDKNFFDQFAEGATSFTEVLKKQGAALELFDYLSKHFNGGVFQLSEKEREALEKSDLSRFALFLEGKLEGIQFVFWRLYSFNDLPVELISNIYEEFLEKRPGVVYTPPYLVNFLLDEAMPFSNLETGFKVLDPACGSGVFLVGAYRRLIYRWRKKNNWKNPDLATLKTLLRENIFGSDKDPDAVNLTVFSLCLALCDELTPLQIWEDLQFDNLRDQNLFADDFFNLLNENKFSPSTFDLIIGNPPFEAKLTNAAEVIEAQMLTQRTIEPRELIEKKNQIKLPDNQIALLFLEQVIKLCGPQKLVCLIQPSGPFLYNNTSFQFRKYLLGKYLIPQIIDFTHISRILFGKNGDVPTAAIFIKNEAAKETGLLHITVRRTKPHKEKIFFELDSYDFHYVPRKLALNDPLIWKSNFLGGSRFHQLITRLKTNSTLKEFLKIKVKKHGWEYGEGFIQGKIEEIRLLESLLAKGKNLTKTEAQKIVKLEKKYKKAEYITSKPIIPSKHFDPDNLDKKLPINSEVYFRYPAKEKLFKPPHILVKEEIKDDGIPVALTNRYLTFKHRIVGIHAPKKEEEELIDLYDHLRSRVVLFYLAGTSSEYMINRSSSFLKKDIDNIPYLANNNDQKLNDYEKILVSDFWNHLLEFRRNGETSPIALKDASDKQLKSYSKVFCDVLNSVYSNLHPHDPFHTDSYICYPFYFDEKPNIDFQNNGDAEKNIEQLVRKTAGVSLRLTRVLRIYDGNVIYLIKPRKLRYWLQSTALRDADETFADLRKQGY